MNRVPFGVDEWYHCYTRGVDKRRTFQSAADYRRFMQILYLANSADPVHRSNLGESHHAVFTKKRGVPLVAIAAYCIMPNHFHLLIREVREGGIVKFMQKVGTSYAMYFNIKNQRVGNLFVKPFRSRHIDGDNYWHSVAQYIHLNPAEIYDPKWKEGRIRNMSDLEQWLMQYPYCSLTDYANTPRTESVILDIEASSVIRDATPPLRSILGDAQEYYRNLTI